MLMPIMAPWRGFYMHVISISNLDIVFGNHKNQALALLDAGRGRDEIREKTGQIVGVNHANLNINKGEIFVLMGLSGSGKSTLLRAINGLCPITRGEIILTINEQGLEKTFSIAELDPVSMRHMRSKHISMVFQKFALLPWKNVLDNVAFGLEIARVSKNIREQRAYQCLELVGLSEWAKRLPKELSGGMQQRVGLARALATDASILLMDEPFSALDPLIRNHLQQELLHLQKSLNKTIIFVSHDLEEALKIGSRIAIMQDGSIVQSGSAEEIVAKPKTAYVKDFVANIDHMRLLKARAIMITIGDLKFSDDHMAVFLDQSGIYRCLLDENGRPRRSICHDLEGRIVPWTLYQSGTFADNDIVLGNEHLMIKDVINAVGRTKKPMIIQDKSGKMIGAVTTESILRALSMK